jgi:gas vesicle protein
VQLPDITSWAFWRGILIGAIIGAVVLLALDTFK